MKILESIDVQPSPNLIETLGYSGYSIESAIADIVDNSIAAKATEIEVLFDFNFNNSKIKIIDNGVGMDRQGLIDCVTIAKKSINDEREDYDLGRFGLGLKSASMSFSRVFTVTSKTKKSDVLSIQMDVDKILELNQWKVDFVEPNDRISNHGTIIQWDKLTFLNLDHESMRDYFYILAEKVEHHLGKVFFEFIDNEKLVIKVNGNVIKKIDPFFRRHEKTRSLGSTSFEYEGSIIEIEPFILPVYEDLNELDRRDLLGNGLEEQQGFYIYRNNRLIVNSSWLDLKGVRRDNKSNYARIRVTISKDLDTHFNINFAKNSASIPPKLIPQFQSIAKIARKESSDNFNYKIERRPKKKKSKDDNVDVWLLEKNGNGYRLLINYDHPIIQELTKNLGTTEKSKLFSLLASSIPIKDIQYNKTYEAYELDTNKFEIFLLEEYEKMSSYGMNRDQILHDLAREQPFSDNITLMNELLIKKGKI